MAAGAGGGGRGPAGGRAGKAGPVHTLAPAPPAPTPVGPAAEPVGPASEPAGPGRDGAAGEGLEAVRALHRGLGNAAVGRLLRDGGLGPGAGLPAPVRTELDRPGRPLDAAVRIAMEHRFGADFGQVRVHTDDAAAGSARAVRAGAYTVGTRLVFGSGRYDPGSPRGLRLLAHELAHVVQQRRGGPDGRSPEGDPALEAAADRAADAFLSSREGRIEVGGASAIGLSLAPEDEHDHDPRTPAEYGQAYQQLRQMQELAQQRADEMHQHRVDTVLRRRMRTWTQKFVKEQHRQPTRTEREERRETLRGLISGNFTVSYAFVADEQGHLHPVVSSSDATRGLGGPKRRARSERRFRQLFGMTADEQFAFRAPDPKDAAPKPAKKSGGKSSQGAAAPATGTSATGKPAPLPAAGAHGAAGSTQQHGVAEPDHDHKAHHAEANTAAHAAARGHQVVVQAASHRVCEKCVQKLTHAGSSIATEQKFPPEASQPHHVSGPVQAVAAATSGKPTSTPPTVYPGRSTGLKPDGSAGTGTTKPGRSGGSGSSDQGGGGGTPPPTKSTQSAAAGGTGRAAPAAGKGKRAKAGGASAGMAADVAEADTVTADTKPRPDPPPAAGRRTKAGTGTKAQTGTGTSTAAGGKPPMPTMVKPPGTAVANQAGATATNSATAAHPMPSGGTGTKPTGTAKPADAGGTSAGTTAHAAPAGTTAHAAPNGTTATKPAGTTTTAAPTTTTAAPSAGTVQAGGTAPGTTAKPTVKPLVATPTIVTPATHGGTTAARPTTAAAATAKPDVKPDATPAVTTGTAAPKTTDQTAAGGPVRGTRGTTTAKDASHFARTTTVSATGDTGRTRSRATTTDVGFGGVSRTQVDTRTTGGTGSQRTSTTGVTRGDGRLGLGRSTEHARGEFDEQGNLTRGSSAKTDRHAGIVNDDKGVGAFGDVTHQRRQVHGNGLSTSQSIGANGSFQVKADPIPDTNPVRYTVSLTVSLGASVGLGGELGKEKSVSVGVHGAGSVTGTFSHEMSAEEMQHYVGTLRRNGEGGAEQEMQIIKLAAHGGLDDARKMLAAIQQGRLAKADLKPGEEVSLETQGSVGGSLGATVGKTGGPSVSAQVSYSKSRRIKFTRANRDGKTFVTVEVVDATDRGVAAGGSYAGVGGGVEYGDQKSVGRSVTFSIPDGDQTTTDRLLAVDSAQQLDALAGTNHASVVSDTHAHGTAERNAVSAELFGAEAKFGDEGGAEESDTVDETGRHVRRFKGYHGGGASLGPKGGPQLKYSETSAVDTEVGPDNTATGDASTTTSETTFGGIKRALTDRFTKKPLKGALDTATGKELVVPATTETVGMKLSDSDYNTIIATASEDSGRDWDKAFAGRVNQSMGDWRKLRHQIADAHGDKAAVAKALEDYAHDNDQAAQAIAKVVRPAGSAQGGIGYDFPAGMEQEQSTYNSLVVGDPVKEARGLVDAGKPDDAIARLTVAATKLDELSSKLTANPDKFTNKTAYSEMTRRVPQRANEVRAELATLKPATTDVAGPPTPEQDAAQKHDQAAAAIERFVPGLRENQRNEQAVFAKVDKELNHPPWYASPDVTQASVDLTALKKDYVEWDVTITEIKRLLQEAGRDPAGADSYAPNRARWTELNNHPEMTKWR